MKLDLEFVGLNAPLFFEGINWGDKLHTDPKKNSKGPVILWYDTELRHTVMVHGTKVCLIELVASMTLKDPSQIGLANTVTKKVINTETLTNFTGARAQVSGPGIGMKMNAQVETPLDKVQGKPGRRPRYQGEESQGE